MTKSIVSIALLALSTSVQAQKLTKSAGHIGFCYPISTHGTYARDYSNKFSVHALVGVSGGEEAFCVSGLTNVVLNSSKGFIGAGFSNHISDNAIGITAAGFANKVNHHTRGAQLAGFANISGSVKGAQLAGFCNVNRGYMRGFQGAGFMNINGRNIRGTQLAGFMNTSRNVKGAQLAGYINIADTVNTQVSGFINIAKTAKVQLSGFINIADSCDYPIGIINIIKKGEKSIGISLDANRTNMATFRSGGRVLYGMAGIGYNFRKPDNTLYALEAGLGAHFTVSKNVRFNIEASSTSFTDLTDEIFITSSVRFLPALTFGKHLEIFAGPAVNSVQSDDFSGESISGKYIWSDKSWGTFTGVYLSAYGGINYRF